MTTRSSLEPPPVKSPASTPNSPVVQRKCDSCRTSGPCGHCEERKKKNEKTGFLRRSGTRAISLAEAPHLVHEALSCPGRPLDSDVRDFMESRLEYDFSRVRIHTDAKASESARAIAATAYTVGRDVVFSADHYSPSTRSGRELVAHELVHVIQQGHQPSPTSLRIGSADDHFEREAEHIARQVDSSPRQDKFKVAGLHQAPVSAQRETSGDELRGTVQRQELPAKGPRPRTNDEQVEAGPPRETVEAGKTPNAEDCAPFHVAGDLQPKTPNKIIRIAWTLDDGPTKFTAHMRERLGPRRGTWYIVRDRLPRDGKKLRDELASMKRLQDEGHEYGIHSFHPKLNHVAWFPIELKGAVAKGYDRVDAAMADLRQFVGLLRNHGLQITFIRLPGGAWLGAAAIPGG